MIKMKKMKNTCLRARRLKSCKDTRKKICDSEKYEDMKLKDRERKRKEREM